MQLLWTAFVMGLAGGMHCILMCGPLAASLHSARFGKAGLWYRNFLYQGGRILSYLIIGLISGAVGKLVSVIFYQQVLSIISGALLLLWALLYIFQGVFGGRSRAMKLWSGIASGLFGKLWKQKSDASVLGLGILNGFLPCGLVYLAAAASINNGSIGYSMAYMMLFGLGTLPAMTGIIAARNYFPVKWRFSLRKFSPVFLTILGLLFVVRGLGLNIPYVSPGIIQSTKGQIPVCCSKNQLNIKN
jgi:uncharacterized protein